MQRQAYDAGAHCSGHEVYDREPSQSPKLSSVPDTANVAIGGTINIFRTFIIYDYRYKITDFFLQYYTFCIFLMPNGIFSQIR